MGKVVVTGFGLKIPGAFSKHQFKSVLENGICTHELVQTKGKNGIHQMVAGVIRDDFQTINGKNYKRYPRLSRIAMAATDDAIEMAQIIFDKNQRVAVILGTSAGGLRELERNSENFRKYETFPIESVSLGDPHTLSSSVATHIGVKDQSYTLTTGCAASSDAILLGKLLLETGQADVCIVGGADACLGDWISLGFLKLKSIQLDEDILNTGVPFSLKHKGFVMAEGAGILVLERENDAKIRKANILGTIMNGYANNDSLPMYQTDLTGQGMAKALKGAIGNHIPSYVNSQALGLITNDTVEYKAHQSMFGASVPITSIKGMIGHPFGASGAIQVISALISMEYGFIPPTIKTNADGYEDLPIVLETQYQEIKHVAITTHGNGGNNTCLLISRYH
ncbi:beta-ketoacyl-[acyl-carrier-protein] synthase family protein [Heyndrickxia sporothermodurans]|uniref:beta-ketoacyl-[acyl-carrier-protein] synthase family protein n=1 Tax=Heyndrickxia sporothermodurans TaxID=46224 RepID=UPI0035D64BB6